MKSEHMNKKKYNLSVIVPVYNSEKYLKHCITSLLSQTYQRIEIILIDDGSFDHSGEVCDRYAKEVENIFVYHQKNSGANEARRTGIFHARSKYIAFVDSDDWVEPDLFTFLISVMEREKADMVTMNVTVDAKEESKVQKSAIPVGGYTHNEIEKYIYPRMVYDDIQRKPGIFAYLVGKIFRREQLIESISDLDYRLTYGEDGAIVFPMLAKLNKLVVTDYAGYHYIQHEASMTHNLSLEMFIKIRYLEDYLAMKFKKAGKYELVEAQIQYFVRDLLYQVIKKEYDVECGKILCQPPYEMIPQGSRLVIYGAGKAGKEFVRLFLQNQYVRIVAWVDKNYGKELYAHKIERPESIKTKEYDYILIALTDSKTVLEVQEYLCSLGIPKERIIWKEINWG